MVNSIISEKTESLFEAFSSRLSSEAKCTYKRNVLRACDFLGLDFIDITLENARIYRDYLYSNLVANKSLSKKTANTAISSLRSFGDFIESNYADDTYKNPFKDIITPTVSPDVSLDIIPTWEELDHLLELAKNYNDSLYVILLMVAKMGVPATSLLKLKLNDIHLDTDKPFILLEGLYRKKEHLVALPADIAKILRNYLVNNNIENIESEVFFNNSGKPLSKRMLSNYLLKIQEFSTPVYTLKGIKGRAIISMLSAGADTKEIAEYTGLEERRLCDYSKIHSLPCPAELTHISYMY